MLAASREILSCDVSETTFTNTWNRMKSLSRLEMRQLLGLKQEQSVHLIWRLDWND